MTVGVSVSVSWTDESEAAAIASVEAWKLHEGASLTLHVESSEPIIQVVYSHIASSIAGPDGSIDLGAPAPEPPTAPVAGFSYAPAAPKKGEIVTFDASASTGDIARYDWDFGEGTPESTFEATIEHMYVNKADYTVVLTVVDSADQSAQATQVVTVA